MKSSSEFAGLVRLSDARSSPKAVKARVSAICSPPGTAGESPVSAGSTAVPRVRMARTGIKARQDHVTIRVVRLRSKCDRGALPDICGYLSRNQVDIGAPIEVLPSVSHCPLSYGKIKTLASFFPDSSLTPRIRRPVHSALDEPAESDIRKGFMDYRDIGVITPLILRTATNSHQVSAFVDQRSA